jgi:N-hydroxyarylamine O-acetyltransferase
MDTTAYLDRINYHGPLNRDHETLGQLQLAHLLAVPFENLSIHAGEPIVLDDVALFDKIVRRRRGGFCYELNGLFAALLRALGFDVKMLSAGVANDDGVFSREFDHMTLLVSLDQRWLVDVGFGDSFVEPLLFEPGRESVQRGFAYRIISDENHFVLEQAAPGDKWKAQYRFSLTPYQYSDFVARCEYQQTSPESHFTQKRICSLLTGAGRISVSDSRFIVSEDGARRERTITGAADYANLLREHFGIVM